MYNFDDFKELLIQRFAEDVTNALSERIKNSNTLDNIRRSLLNVMRDFRRGHEVKKLDGLAWKNDLTPILTNYMVKLIANLS